jgi:molybdate transport system substrate-binding protein
MPGKRVLLWLVAMLAPLCLRAAEINVYAAASLSDALLEIAKRYQASSGDRVQCNLGASSALALQIKQGAPADIFFSADEKRMDDLARTGLIDTSTRRSMLSNLLVVVVSPGRGASIVEPADLARPAVRWIALADPETVPAGIYAREWLQRMKLWAQVAPKVVPTENVRACLAAVESGNVDAGIVYKTDALVSTKVKTAYEVAIADGPVISYPLAVLKESRNPAAARRFVAYLLTADARAVFTRYGFLAVR